MQQDNNNLLCDQGHLDQNGGKDSSVESDTHKPRASDVAVGHDQIVLEDESTDKEDDNRVVDGIGSPAPESLDVKLIVEQK